jgi:phospholipid/cholesterol/gamma-HCH transport system ATP-binding protein
MPGIEISNETMIRLEHLRKRFKTQQVLADVNLEIKKGETMVVIGRSGQGKSVILKHIMGLLQPDGGRVMVNNEEISSPRKVELYRIRKKLGMLFQGAALFDSMDVGENIAFPLREHSSLSEKEIADIVIEKLEMVGLRNIERKMPSELSGGMKKRVGLARVIAMNPEVILYDEPTTGLDPITSDTINDLILEMQEKLKVTSIVVTHDMVSAYKVADRIAMLHEGSVIFTGTPNQLKSSRDPRVQQFIRGQKKLIYDGTIANPEEADQFNQKFNIADLTGK